MDGRKEANMNYDDRKEVIMNYNELYDRINDLELDISRLSEELRIEKALSLEISSLESGYIKSIHRQVEQIRLLEEAYDSQYKSHEAELDALEEESETNLREGLALQLDALFALRIARLGFEGAEGSKQMDTLHTLYSTTTAQVDSYSKE